MKEVILSKLKTIEDKEQIKILYAVESGSRGWGFESEDSDYDVRFIYTHPLDWYLSIEDKKDVIEYPVSDQLDINGWDIKKALKLFRSSNPPLYEWLNSPIVYLDRSDFTSKLRVLLPKFFSPLSCLHHYLNMARGNYKAYLSKQKVRVKKYFYVLRPVLACMWIEKHRTMPCMEFEKLLKAQQLDEQLRVEIQGLLERKKSGSELGEERKLKIIDSFLKNKLEHFEDYVKRLDTKPSTQDTVVLDNLFRQIIKTIEK